MNDRDRVPKIEDVAVLTPLCERGLVACVRLRDAISSEQVTRLAADAARYELWDAQRESETAGRLILEAGYHDVGHLRTQLGKS
jgi:hypothetical protein